MAFLHPLVSLIPRKTRGSTPVYIIGSAKKSHTLLKAQIQIYYLSSVVERREEVAIVVTVLDDML